MSAARQSPGKSRQPRRSRAAGRGARSLLRIESTLLLCAALCAGCALPPDEVEEIRAQLQARLATGQVYVTHSPTELSYMIRNSEFTRAPRAKKDELVGSVEKDALDFLARYQNYKYIRIYFLGVGTAGIDEPYICEAASSACLRVEENPSSSE